MPWIENCEVHQRMCFVAACLKGGKSVSALCREYEISRKTAYKWLGRYRSEGASGIFDRSRAPHSSPRALADDVVDAVLTVRLDHPSWGPAKIKAYLERQAPERVWPSASSIWHQCNRAGLTKPLNRRVHPPIWESPFDSKSWILTGDYTQVEPLTLSMDKILALSHENQLLIPIERNSVLLMAHIAQGKLSVSKISDMIPRNHQGTFRSIVAPLLNCESRYYRNRALVITFYMLGIQLHLIEDFILYTRRTVRRFIRLFEDGEYKILFEAPKHPKKKDRQDLKDILFTILHSPPRDYDINRTTWTITLLKDVLKDKGSLIGEDTISRMIRDEGFVFRKTRKVLTSNDPEYRVKLEKITRTLRRLGPADRFFSIDEYGPVSIRKRGGRIRVKKGVKPTVPQYQKSKGYIIITAALELSTNQISHFYSSKKDTDEMIKLIHVLIDEYRDCRQLYLSWDAASWHSSKRFNSEVKRVNSRKFRIANQSPSVILRPLPARAQFLNVIESVFSGLSKAIIDNSNYESVDEAKTAIDRYFYERNVFFQNHPSKAGNKIWGEEQVPSYFSVSHNCKNPKFR